MITCPFCGTGVLPDQPKVWTGAVEVADNLDKLIDEMFTEHDGSVEAEIRQMLWDNKITLIRAAQSLREPRSQ